jgi:ribose 5-phosphate isomerase A
LNPKLDWIERAKRNAALEAVKNVKDCYAVGLGSGSTTAYAIEELGKKIEREKLSVLGVPTSYQAFMLAVKHGIPVTTLEEHPTLDLAIDGTDQIDDELDLIKGMGGALAREKIVASAAKRFIVIADETKKVKVLGENGHPVPIEVLPFASSLVACKIRDMDGKPVLREGKGKVGPVITDNGNVIIDADFGLIHNPTDLQCMLKELPGVVETGLFVKMADAAYLGRESCVTKLQKRRSNSKP